MIEQFIKSFKEKHTESDAINIIRTCRCEKNYFLGIVLAQYFLKLFPHSYTIRNECGMCYYFSNQFEKSYDMYKDLLLLNLTQKESEESLFNSHFCIDKIYNRYTYYNPEIVKSISNNEIYYPKVTFTITTCKRLELFIETMNSFLNCCTDIHKISNWICVDDNSSNEDRQKMKELYPFFQFIFKDENEKGHAKSMNIIRNIVDTPYVFHMEDDWKFFNKRNYITDCLSVLNHQDVIGQCLINKNYAETELDIRIKGGFYNCTRNNTRYYIHEYCPDELEFKEKYGYCFNCAYWPHYSLRPSLLKTYIWKELGKFNENTEHFELDYANRYIKKGYISAFLESIYCIHTGRLTSERNNKNILNAYQLNDVDQFTKKDNIPKEDNQYTFDFKAIVINLKSRPDRLENFKKEFLNTGMKSLCVFQAIDGRKLFSTRQLLRIFDGNDYNMRQGFVGCALSHINIYIEILKCDINYCLIMEDDIKFIDGFSEKLRELIAILYSDYNNDWDMLYLGHHLRNEYITDKSNNILTVEKWDTDMSLKKSLGGTSGYIITNRGARKMLEFINERGMTNGIDTMQQKAADKLSIFYCEPHLISSECFRGNNSPDTDIQFNYKSLTIPIDERLNLEKEFYNCYNTELEEITEERDILKIEKDSDKAYFYRGEELDIINMNKEIKYPHYTLDNDIIFIIPNPNEKIKEKGYFERLKLNGEWNIDEAINILT